MVDTVYPHLRTTNAANAAQLAQTAILTATNDCVNRINAVATEIFPGEAYDYLSADSVLPTSNDRHDDIPIDFLNTVTPSGIVSSSSLPYYLPLPLHLITHYLLISYFRIARPPAINQEKYAAYTLAQLTPFKACVMVPNLYAVPCIDTTLKRRSQPLALMPAPLC